MKTLLVIAALVVSLNGFAENKSDNFVYNDVYNTQNMVSARTVYRSMDSSLQLYRQYIYKYDENGRIVEKEAEKWDTFNSCWTPDYQLSYSYEGKNFTIDYAGWNASKKCFKQISERTVYKPNMDGLTLSFYKYTRNASDNSWKLQEQYNNLDYTSETRLIAENLK